MKAIAWDEEKGDMVLFEGEREVLDVEARKLGAVIAKTEVALPDGSKRDGPFIFVSVDRRPPPAGW